MQVLYFMFGIVIDNIIYDDINRIRHIDFILSPINKAEIFLVADFEQ